MHAVLARHATMAVRAIRAATEPKAAGGEEAVKRAMNAPNATQETKLKGKTLLDELSTEVSCTVS